MKKTNRNLFLWVVLAGAVLVGCGDSVPENTMPAGGGNPHVSGSPEERIKNIQGDAMLTPEEKERRIKVVKERNGLK